jgi:hypothetical protein
LAGDNASDSANVNEPLIRLPVEFVFRSLATRRDATVESLKDNLKVFDLVEKVFTLLMLILKNDPTHQK